MHINQTGQTMWTGCYVIDLHEYLKITLKGRRNPGSPMKRVMDVEMRPERAKISQFTLQLHDEMYL